MLAAFPVVAQETDPDKILINKRPLYDLSQRFQELVSENKIDLSAPFAVQGSGKLMPDGKIDISTFRFTSTSGDKQVIDLIRSTIESVNGSGYLQYLYAIGGKEYFFSLSQDDKSFTAITYTDLDSPRRTQSIRTTIDLALKFYKDKKSIPEADENDRDDLLFLNGTSIVAEGKRLTIKFEMPKEVVQTLLKKKLRGSTQKAAGLN